MAIDLRAEVDVKIGGRAADASLLLNLIELRVETNLHLPDMFTLEVFDDNLEFVGSSSLDLGKEVEITIAPVPESGEGRPKSLVKKCEITALEPTFARNGRATLLIRGYDFSHRLHRARMTRTFLKQKDSDIVSKVAKEASLSVSADATSLKHDYVIQHNQTNMEFILDRARRNGYDAYVSEGKLFFKKGDATPPTGPTLEWGHDLLSFRPRVTGVHQSDKAIATGWDPLAKKALTGKASAVALSEQGGFTKSGGAAAKTAFKSAAETALVHLPVAKADELAPLAKAALREINRRFIQAEGECWGNPDVQAGKLIKVKLAKTATRFDGKYRVTAATHIYRSGRYFTQFSISGDEPYTVSHLVSGSGGNGYNRDKPEAPMPGVAVGLVTDLKDPDKLGRVKVLYPWLPKDKGTDIGSDWVRAASPMAGNKMGIFFLPEVNDEVLIAFEHGDPHRPYIIGSLFSKKDQPPEPGAVKDGKVDKRIIKSRSGHVILLDDTKGKEGISIIDKTGKNTIVISSKDGKLGITMKGDIDIKTDGKLNLISKGDLSLEGAKVSIKAKSDVKIAGVNIDIKGTGKAGLAAAAVEVKSTGGGVVSIKGPLVNVNNGALEVM